MAQNVPQWGDDIINSRDIIARIDDLEAERDAWVDERTLNDEDAPAGLIDYWIGRWADEYPDESDELRRWCAVRDAAEGYASDWQYGETLILDSYFETYAQELADDIGAVDRTASWPNTYIDWAAAADALRQDYSAVEVDGLTYWTR